MAATARLGKNDTKSRHVENLVLARPKLTRMQVVCLEGYFALLQSLPPKEIGAEEIRAWFHRCKPGMRRPSGPTVLLALVNGNVEHRPRGRPKGGRARHSREGSPLLSTTRRPRDT